ncbi:MAG: hypothetical protein HYS24_02095 [Ignavibacteriales bacterium]|nr:hypothetical protein [Ignavibacteriales bacterium]
MKKVITYSLIFSLILQLNGCYSFQSIDNVNPSQLHNIEDKDIKITLIDGRIIYSKSWHHTLVTDTAPFILVSGSLNKKSNGRSETFKGKIYPAQYKSITQDKNRKVYNILLNNGDIIRVMSNDYFGVNSTTGNGFIVWENENEIKYDISDIKSIEVDKINIIGITLAATGILLFGSIIFLMFAPSIGNVGI